MFWLMVIAGCFAAYGLHRILLRWREQKDLLYRLRQAGWWRFGGLFLVLFLLFRVPWGRSMAFLLMQEWFRQQPFFSSDAPPHEKARPSSGGMSYAEACACLGVEANAEEKEIQAAYRRLMKRNHPDKGGNAWLASHITEARDILLAHRRMKNDR